MPHRFQCPHCACALRVSESVTASHLTCPRCLAEIPNPAVAATDSGHGDTPVPATLLERDTRQDLKGLGCGLVLLPLMFAAGTALYGHAFRARGYIFYDVRGPVSFEVLLGALAVLTLGSVGVWLWRQRTSHRLLVVLQVLGVLVLIPNLLVVFAAIVDGDPGPALVILTALAILIFISVAIARSQSKWPVGVGTLLSLLALVGGLALGGLAFGVLFFFVCIGVQL